MTPATAWGPDALDFPSVMKDNVQPGDRFHILDVDTFGINIDRKDVPVGGRAYIIGPKNGWAVLTHAGNNSSDFNSAFAINSNAWEFQRLKIELKASRNSFTSTASNDTVWFNRVWFSHHPDFPPLNKFTFKAGNHVLTNCIIDTTVRNNAAANDVLFNNTGTEYIEIVNTIFLANPSRADRNLDYITVHSSGVTMKNCVFDTTIIRVSLNDGSFTTYENVSEAVAGVYNYKNIFKIKETGIEIDGGTNTGSCTPSGKMQGSAWDIGPYERGAWRLH